eukprot:4885909-Pleurochrysis_carterae.AAC.2
MKIQSIKSTKTRIPAEHAAVCIVACSSNCVQRRSFAGSDTRIEPSSEIATLSYLPRNLHMVPSTMHLDDD